MRGRSVSNSNQSGEFARAIVEAREYWSEIADTNVVSENFAQHGAKIRGQREVAAVVQLTLV